MKKNTLYLIFSAFPLLFACNQTEKKAANTEADSLTNETCYAAVFEKDSANLSLSVHQSGKVTGKLMVSYGSKTTNKGEIEGAFKGDTLMVDYRFKTGTDSVNVFTNPLAFLKKEGKLIMGVGQIETSLGRSYFVKGKPINFEAAKFTFQEKPCQ